MVGIFNHLNINEGDKDSFKLVHSRERRFADYHDKTSKVELTKPKGGGDSLQKH